MFTTEAKRLESLIQRVFRLDQENDLKRQKEQPYQRLRELEQQLRKQEVAAGGGYLMTTKHLPLGKTSLIRAGSRKASQPRFVSLATSNSPRQVSMAGAVGRRPQTRMSAIVSSIRMKLGLSCSLGDMTSQSTSGPCSATTGKR